MNHSYSDTLDWAIKRYKDEADLHFHRPTIRLINDPGSFVASFNAHLNVLTLNEAEFHPLPLQDQRQVMLHELGHNVKPSTRDPNNDHCSDFYDLLSKVGCHTDPSDTYDIDDQVFRHEKWCCFDDHSDHSEDDDSGSNEEGHD